MIKVIREANPELSFDDKRFKVLRKGKHNTRIQFGSGLVVVMPSGQWQAFCDEKTKTDSITVVQVGELPKVLEQGILFLIEQEKADAIEDHYPWIHFEKMSEKVGVIKDDIHGLGDEEHSTMTDKRRAALRKKMN